MPRTAKDVRSVKEGAAMTDQPTAPRYEAALKSWLTNVGRRYHISVGDPFMWIEGIKEEAAASVPAAPARRFGGIPPAGDTPDDAELLGLTVAPAAGLLDRLDEWSRRWMEFTEAVQRIVPEQADRNALIDMGHAAAKAGAALAATTSPDPEPPHHDPSDHDCKGGVRGDLYPLASTDPEPRHVPIGQTHGVDARGTIPNEQDFHGVAASPDPRLAESDRQSATCE